MHADTVYLQHIHVWHRKHTYPQLCEAILRLFIDVEEVSDEDLRCIVTESCARFDDPFVTPVKAVGNLQVCELWHGPTLAFKDLGLQILARLMTFFLTRGESTRTILVGTSGDTGEAAVLCNA